MPSYLLVNHLNQTSPVQISSDVVLAPQVVRTPETVYWHLNTPFQSSYLQGKHTHTYHNKTPKNHTCEISTARYLGVFIVSTIITTMYNKISCNYNLYLSYSFKLNMHIKQMHSLTIFSMVILVYSIN